MVDSLGGGALDVKLGNFGHIQYGTTIMANLVYSEKNSMGCTTFSNHFESNSMVIVDAGGCPITQKVRNIEKAGGQVAVIGDGWYESIEDVFFEDVDGSGFSLTIPALLIGRDDAAMLKTALSTKMMVKMKATLEISHSESKQVDVGLWYGSTLDLDPKLLQ